MKEIAMALLGAVVTYAYLKRRGCGCAGEGDRAVAEATSGGTIPRADAFTGGALPLDSDKDATTTGDCGCGGGCGGC